MGGVSIVLSYVQARQLLQARGDGAGVVIVSPDLNRSVVEVVLDGAGACFPGGERLSWADCERIAGEESKCFVLEGGAIREIRAHSEVTGWVRALYPTEGAPTVLVSGIPMHRIKRSDPYRDTLMKIKAVRPVVGQVLDTATGLGYTAIEAAKSAERVITVEIDPAALEIARYNPWSRELFDNPKIEPIIGDVYEVIESFKEGAFSVIIHDPPAFSLAGELYSAAFYGELWRVLKVGGRLFHYVGDPDSKAGQGVMRGVMRRLKEVGFERIVRRPEAFGVVAYR